MFYKSSFFGYLLQRREISTHPSEDNSVDEAGTDQDMNMLRQWRADVDAADSSETRKTKTSAKEQ